MPQKLVTVATTVTKLCDNVGERKTLTIQNTDSSNYIIVGDDPTDVTDLRGYYLYPYGSITFQKATGDDPERARYAIANGASCVASVADEVIRKG